MSVAALVALPPTLPTCLHPLVELLSLDGRTLDAAVRVCAHCHAVISQLDDYQIEAIRARAEKLTSKGWQEYVELLVECENAQLSPYSAARARVARLVGEAYARKWGAK